MLWKLAELIERDLEELAELESIDNGKPYAVALVADLPLAIDMFRYMGGGATKISGRTSLISCCRTSTMYSDISLFIDGQWTSGAGGRTIPIVNPATGEPIGTVAHADKGDLDHALEAADKGFRAWRRVSAFDRSKIIAQGGQPVARPGRRDRATVDSRTG
jgi:acyl-CoA reductase-like NAD-dependent aldehyde dehydrogenase